MDSARQNSLLDYFTQTESTTHLYGIDDSHGLSICKQLVLAMGGEIGLSSAPRRGSTFWFSVRLARISPTSDTPPVVSQYSGNVLVVEDNLTDQAVISRFLCIYGFEVEAVSNGKQALEALSRKKFDLVFMDCKMQGMDGYEATQCIRTHAAHQTQKDIPIIALTSSAMKGDRERCLRAGMNDYIVKPIYRQVLQNAIDRWLPRRRKKTMLSLVPDPSGHSHRQTP
jgi:CheY-like chemotaxis protein